MIDKEKVIEGLRFTMAMMLFNPITGNDKQPSDLNEDDRTTYDACCGAIELLQGSIFDAKPRVLGVNEIVEGEGYWLTMMDNNFGNRPVICVHKEDDARKPYITLAWQFGTVSWETKTYGTEWRLWSSKPIGREW